MIPEQDDGNIEYKLKLIAKSEERTNDSANVKLKFKYHPEYLKTGSRFIMCEGHLKIVGVILST
jgi:GTPase